MSVERYVLLSKDGHINNVVLWDKVANPDVAWGCKVLLESEAIKQGLTYAPVEPTTDPKEDVEITSEAVNQLLSDMESVKTQNAKISALKKFFESISDQE